VLKAAKLAGLPRITPHDLRRSFARGAYEAGVSFELIRQALGHSNIATTERYVNSVLELDHAATDIWAGTLGDDEEDEM
jgi:integrase